MVIVEIYVISEIPIEIWPSEIGLFVEGLFELTGDTKIERPKENAFGGRAWRRNLCSCVTGLNPKNPQIRLGIQ